MSAKPIEAFELWAWEKAVDEESYAEIKATVTLAADLRAEVERLKAENERLTRERDGARVTLEQERRVIDGHIEAKRKAEAERERLIESYDEANREKRSFADAANESFDRMRAAEKRAEKAEAERDEMERCLKATQYAAEQMNKEADAARASDITARQALKCWTGSLDTLVPADALERLDAAEGGIHVSGPAWVVAEVTRLRADKRATMDVLRGAREALLIPACTAATCAGQNCVSCRSGYEALSAIEELLSALEDKP